MHKKVTHIFRMADLVGLMLILFSVFLEWYSFQIYNFDNNLVVSWSYYLFSEWRTPFSTSSPLNEAMKPITATIPFIINILLIFGILASGYILLVKNIDRAHNLRNYTKYAYVNIFMMLLVGYYVVICPLLYLAPYNLYFPLLSIKNYELELIYFYSIGPGYLLQLISFPLIFPYSVFYHKTVLIFIHEERGPEKILQATITSSQEYIDFDRYIAEEELKNGLTDKKSPLTTNKQEDGINPILTTFMEGKK